jgi:DNA polymerase-3 subunit beta
MRLIEGKYADYRRIIPEISQHPITLQREPFLSSLRRMSLMSSDKSRSVTFQIANGTLHLSSQSPDLGEAHEEIPIEYHGEELKVGFNSKYLMDALSTLDSENVVLEMRSKQHPGVLRSCSGLNHINVVMPMRI